MTILDFASSSPYALPRFGAGRRASEARFGANESPSVDASRAAAIEKALYTQKPRVIFEVTLTQGGSYQGSAWLTY